MTEYEHRGDQSKEIRAIEEFLKILGQTLPIPIWVRFFRRSQLKGQCAVKFYAKIPRLTFIGGPFLDGFNGDEAGLIEDDCFSVVPVGLIVGGAHGWIGGWWRVWLERRRRD